MNGLRSHIKNSKECFIRYPNTSKSVKKTRLRLVFSTHFSVFGYPDETLFLVFDILLQKNKTPGNDGLTIEFYVAFWSLIGRPLVDCVNYSYEFGELSNSQKQAIITLIEKKGKDKRLIKNSRPTSLINVDAKIISRVLAKRLEKVLPNLIHPNQNAFVKGRSIFDAIRTIDDIVDYTKRNSWSGILISIDFEKKPLIHKISNF